MVQNHIRHTLSHLDKISGDGLNSEGYNAIQQCFVIGNDSHIRIQNHLFFN